MRLEEIEHFFCSYNEMEGREFNALAQRGVKDAEEVLKAVHDCLMLNLDHLIKDENCVI